MKTVHIGKATDTISKVPKPPVYMTDSAKVHYKSMGKKLAKIGRLKEIYLDALEGYAEAKALWEFTCRKIREEDIKEYGSGYFQTFKNDVTQNSTWVNLQKQAWKTIVESCKMFGLDPASEKQLDKVDPNQTNLLDELKATMKQSS